MVFAVADCIFVTGMDSNSNPEGPTPGVQEQCGSSLADGLGQGDFRSSQASGEACVGVES